MRRQPPTRYLHSTDGPAEGHLRPHPSRTDGIATPSLKTFFAVGATHMDDADRIPGLAAGERVVHSWPAQILRGDKPSSRQGLLVLTDRRCLFLHRVGFLTGRKFEMDSALAWSLSEIQTAFPKRFSMSIGYGDRMEMNGLEIQGRNFHLDRETSAQSILSEIAKARRNRLTELGTPGQLFSCGNCGAWSALPSRRGAQCSGPMLA